MKVISAEVEELPSKHYSTDVFVEVLVEGLPCCFTISIGGYAPKASRREVERGWEPEWGMDHVESETHLALAEAIVSKLEGLCDG